MRKFLLVLLIVVSSVSLAYAFSVDFNTRFSPFKSFEIVTGSSIGVPGSGWPTAWGTWGS